MKLRLPPSFEAFLSHYRFHLAFAVLGLIYVFNLFIDIMNVDAAQYASISREMMESGSYLEVFHRGRDYLDKPPLLFWLSSLSFNLFGVHNFAYKIPSVLVLILGIYSTYKLAAVYYAEEIAKASALILASTHAYLLMTNDVRTDAMLTGFVIFSVWQLALFLEHARWKALLWAAIGVAGAMMAKGPLGLIIPGAAVAVHLAIHRRWKPAFDWRWAVFFVVIGICLIPMSYGLYTQFDLHPEKFVYGLEGPSGLRFYYWTQSFGRITGENSWNNNLGFSFFFHSILADIFPWTLLLILGLGHKFRQLIKQRFLGQAGQEFLTLGGFVLPFLALSMSNYKLPHYIFPLFPFLAIMMSHALFRWGDLPRFKGALWFQHFLAIVLSLIAPLFFVFVFDIQNPIWWAYIWVFPLAYFLFQQNISQVKDRFLWSTCLMACYFGSITSLYFYPNLLTYQTGSEIGRMVHEAQKGPNQFYKYCTMDLALDFYSQRVVQPMNPEEMEKYPTGIWIYTSEKGLMELQEKGIQARIIKQLDRFPVSRLNGTFLIRQTREKRLEKFYLLEVE